PEKLYNLFSNKNDGVVIISTVEKICALLYQNLSGLFGCAFREEYFKHGLVEYYSSEIKKNLSDNQSWIGEVPFRKRNKFCEQKEYRFCYRRPIIGDGAGCVEKIIFLVNAKNYIDEIIPFGQTERYMKEFCLSRRINCCDLLF